MLIIPVDKMKILIDGRFWGIENAGLGRYTMNLIRSLGKHDTENQYIILLRKKYFDQLKFEKNFKKILVEFRHYTLAEQINLPRILSELNPDLIHFLHFNTPFLYRGNFIVTIHDMLWHKQRGLSVTTLAPHVYAAKYLGYKLIFSKAIKSSQKIIVPSLSVKKDLLGYYRDIDEGKIVVTYEGVDEQLLTSSDTVNVLQKYNLKSPYFIYAGNAYPHKNFPKAIEAVIRLNKVSKKKVMFAIACSRDVFLQRLEMLVRESGTDNYVKILGLVPDKDLGVLYKNSLALLYPSLSEGFGLQGLEAMANGTVACVSEIPVFKEIYQDHALYFDPKYITSIVKTLQEALNMRDDVRREMIKKGQQFVKRYSWDKMAKETLKIYKQCLQNTFNNVK